MIRDHERLLDQLRTLHAQIQRAVVAYTERHTTDALAAVDEEPAGEDTIFALDRVSEEYLTSYFELVIAPERPLVLVAEGIAGGHLPLPRGIREEEAEVRVLLDPIDGTRGLMFQKRPAWILTGVAPNRGAATSLRDVELAIQTEIPLLKQHLADQLWAVRGEGLHAERLNRLTGARAPLHPQPTTATTVANAFATFDRYFPGARGAIAALDEEVMRAAVGPIQPGKAQSYEDQYICSGGQLYNLIAGQDAFVADLRALVEPLLAREGRAFGIACHPYDLATALLAEEAGITLTDGRGHPLDAPCDIHADVSWAGFANAAIRAQMEPPLLDALRRRGLL